MGTENDWYRELVRLTDPTDGTINESTVQVTVNNVAPEITGVTADSPVDPPTPSWPTR